MTPAGCPTHDDIRAILARALPFLTHAGETEFVTLYLVTGEVPSVSLLVGRPSLPDGNLTIGMHCTGLILWARYRGRQTMYDFYTQTHMTMVYFALHRALESLSDER